VTLGTGVSKTSKFYAIFLASVMLFSTASIGSLAGMTPLPNAFAGGATVRIIGQTCDDTIIQTTTPNQSAAMTYDASQGLFLWASTGNSGSEFSTLTVAGVFTSIGSLEDASKGLAFVGSTLYSISNNFDELYEVDPSNGDTLNTETIDLTDETVSRGNALATDPTTGLLWAALDIGDNDSRELVTIDPSDGTATSIGNTGQRINGLAFDVSGNLFAKTGASSSGSLPNSVFSVNTSDGSLTFICNNAARNASSSGGAFARNDDNGSLYITMVTSFVKFNGGVISKCATQTIPNNISSRLSGFTFDQSQGIFLTAQSSNFRELTVDGVISSSLGFLDDNSRGLAFNQDKLYSIDSFSDELHEIDPDDGSTFTTETISLSGPETVEGGEGLATDPTTGILYAILKLDDNTLGPRVLVTLDPSNGDATLIGNLGARFATIAFDSGGTLFAVAGDGSITADTLFTVSKTNASSAPLCSLGGGRSGESIAFNPNDGFLYHQSGSNALFEKIIGFGSGDVGSVLFGLDRDMPLIHTMDPTSGFVTKSTVITSEFPIKDGGNALTAKGSTLFLVYGSGGSGSNANDDVRRLATLDPNTGQTTNIGVLSDLINALAFHEGILYGVTSQKNDGPADENALVTIDQSTAEVTFLCQLPTDSKPVISFNARDNLLHYFTDGDLDGPILDIPNCTVGNPGETMGYDFEYFIYSLISMILPKAEAGGPSLETKGATWDSERELFLVCDNTDFGTTDPDTGDEVVLNENTGFDCKGLAFGTVGSGGGGGAVGQTGAPTIGVDGDGRQIVPCGVKFGVQCFTISAPFHEEFELFEMMSGTHTISITMWCPKGVSDCAYSAIGVMPYSASMDNPTWKIEVHKDFEGNITVVKTDPEGFLGEVTVSDRIEGTFWVTSYTIEFKNIDTDPMMFGVQARTQGGNVWNWYLNEGVQFKDSDAYPSIDSVYNDLLEIDSLCLNEDPNYRYSCAFEKIRERAIQIAEETLRQMMNN